MNECVGSVDDGERFSDMGELERERVVHGFFHEPCRDECILAHLLLKNKDEVRLCMASNQVGPYTQPWLFSYR